VLNDITLFLAGDVMLGRGVDQVLPHPGDPLLREGHMHDARRYVDLAEDENGPILRPVPFDWPWGVLLDALDDARPDGRIVNLETSVTTSDDFAPGKAVHYRMHPANLAALTVARPDVSVLANNHVLDFGTHGLEETLDSLAGAGLQVAGAGRNLEEARRPAVIGLADTRLLVFGVGLTSSGIPDDWAADEGRPGSGRSPSSDAPRRRRSCRTSSAGAVPVTSSSCRSTGAPTGDIGSHTISSDWGMP
jgi:poly-gamma-glutamate capsule biosynthesis protein CapA/YwtB (metallophosphatase superfamily)